jgi:hypothetical protein
MNTFRPVLLAVLGTVLAAGAAQAQKPVQACFRTGDVTAWRAVGTRAVNIQARYREVYRLDFAYPCDALRFAGERIGFDKVVSGPVCSGIDVDVLVHRMSCPVKTITQLTKAQIAALPKNQRP